MRALAAIALLASGCGNVAVRVVDALPDAPLIDVLLEPRDGATPSVFRNIKYTQTTPYAQIDDDGFYFFVVRASNSDFAAPPVFVGPSFHLDHGQTVTAIVTGTFIDGSIRVLVEEEQFGSPNNGQAGVRVVNASPDAPTLAVTVGMAALGEVPRFGTSAASTQPSGETLPVEVSGGGVAAAFTVPPLPNRSGVFLITAGLITASPGLQLIEVWLGGTLGVLTPH
jgi:hypothetical protein